MKKVAKRKDRSNGFSFSRVVSRFREFIVPKKYQELMAPLDVWKFAEITKKYDGDRYVKKFFAWEHLQVLMLFNFFGNGTLRHLGKAVANSWVFRILRIGEPVDTSCISRANFRRDFRIFEEVFLQISSLIRRTKSRKNPMRAKFGPYKLIDGTFLRLCLQLCPWACYRKEEGGVRLSVSLDSKAGCYFPDKVVITPAKESELGAFKDLIRESKPGVTFIVDRALSDHSFFDEMTDHEIFFVTRLKKKVHRSVRRRYQVPETRRNGVQIIRDQDVYLGKGRSRTNHKYRLVVAEIDGEIFEFITNRMDGSAFNIAALYKERWQVELFFKWIKQHLKINKFYSTSENGALTQIYTTLIAYCLVFLYHLKNKLDSSLWETFQNLATDITNGCIEKACKIGIMLLGELSFEDRLACYEAFDLSEVPANV